MTSARGGRLAIDLSPVDNDPSLKEIMARLESQKVSVVKGDLFVRSVSQMRSLSTALSVVGDPGIFARLFVQTHRFLVNPVGELQDVWSEILPEGKTMEKLRKAFRVVGDAISVETEDLAPLFTKASEASWSYSCDSKVSFDRVQILTPDFSGRRPPPSPLKSRAYLYRVPLQQLI